MTNHYESTKTKTSGITHFIIRWIVGSIVLGITAALTPGFSIAGFWTLIFAALVLAILDYLAFRFLGIQASPFGRGITGFAMAAVIIYVTSLFVTGFTVTFWGTLLGALIYGIVDVLIPGKAM